MEKTVPPFEKTTYCPTGGQVVRSMSRHQGKSNVSCSNVQFQSVSLSSSFAEPSNCTCSSGSFCEAGHALQNLTSSSKAVQPKGNPRSKASSTYIKNMPMSWLSILFRTEKCGVNILIRLWITYLLLC